MTPTRTARALEDLNRYREVSASRWVATKQCHPQGRKVGLPVVRWAGRSFRVRPNIPPRSEHRPLPVGGCSERDTHSADHPPAGKKIRQFQICEPRLGRRIRFEPGLSPSPRELTRVPLPSVPIKLPLSFEIISISVIRFRVSLLCWLDSFVLLAHPGYVFSRNRIAVERSISHKI